MTTEKLQDDIQYIRGIIENNQRALIDNGVMFITNGICILIGLALTALSSTLGLGSYIAVMWVILVFIMIALDSILPKRIDPNLPKKTFTSTILQANFAATGFPMLVLMLLFFFTDGLPLPVMIFADSALLGVMFFMFGVIINLNMMKALAFVWWAFMFVLLYWEQIGDEWLMSFSFAFLVGILQLIPGIIIYRKWRALYADKQV